jgi:hypothetical protein
MFGSKELTDEKDNKRDYKKIIGFALIAIAMFLIGTIIGNMLHKDDPNIEAQFDFFKAGYHDSYITVIKNTIDMCSNSSLSVYHWMSSDGSMHKGILFRCPTNESVVLPVSYTQEFYKSG